MTKLDDKPTVNAFSDNITRSSKENNKKYYDDVCGQFIDRMVLQKVCDESHDDDDYVMNYGLCFIFLSILILQMKDTAAEADGNRNLVKQKLLLAVFKSMGNYSKYAIEMFITIAQIECLLIPRLSEEFKWGFFVNYRGGAGRISRMIWPRKYTTNAVRALCNEWGLTKL